MPYLHYNNDAVSPYQYFSLIIILFFNIQFLYANDGFSGIDAGGLYFKKSKHISIEKEILIISQKSIKVKYYFKNNSSQAISSIISFPIPLIHCSILGSPASYLEDFITYVRKIASSKN